MIFMLFSIMWGRIQEQTTNFKHLVHETWPQTCGRVVFKFYKKANEFRKLWNLSRCHDIICGGCDKNLRRFRTSCHVRFKNLRRSFMILWRGRRGGKHRMWQTCAKPPQFFITASTYDIMTSRQVSRFLVFVCFL